MDVVDELLVLVLDDADVVVCVLVLLTLELEVVVVVDDDLLVDVLVELVVGVVLDVNDEVLLEELVVVLVDVVVVVMLVVGAVLVVEAVVMVEVVVVLLLAVDSPAVMVAIVIIIIAVAVPSFAAFAGGFTFALDAALRFFWSLLFSARARCFRSLRSASSSRHWSRTHISATPYQLSLFAIDHASAACIGTAHGLPPVRRVCTSGLRPVASRVSLNLGCALEKPKTTCTMMAKDAASQ